MCSVLLVPLHNIPGTAKKPLTRRNGEMGKLTVVFEFSFSSISQRSWARLTITHPVTVPWIPGPAFCYSQLYTFFFVSSAPKQPVPQLLSLGHHSEVWLFQLGLPNDSRISVVSGVGIKYKGVPGSAGPSLQGGSVCLSVCLASPFAPFIPAITLNTPFFTREELAVLIPPLDGKSASTLA